VLAPEGTAEVNLVVSKPVRSHQLHHCVESLLRADLPPPAAAPVSRKAPSAFGARVLVAEDNAVNQDVARAYLRELGCEATLAGDGETAVALVREQPFDLVLMDCMMPRLDGYGAARAIREFEALHPGRPRVPIIALTASALQGEKERCVAAGMDDFLPKPLPLEQLRAMLSLWLSRGDTVPAPGPEAPDPGERGPVLEYRTVEQLRRLTSGDGSSLLAKLIQVFLSDSARRLDALEVAIQQGNAVEVGMIAHTLKSASATLGATRLSARFGALERAAATTSDTVQWALEEQAIRVEYERAIEALEATAAEVAAHA
jgi:CheY-like chemotaxis protein/HPt (histidine-containing phosphotransfer) domain-containing protein